MTEASTAAAWQVFDGWTAAVSPTRSTASWKVLDEFEARLVQAAANNLVRLQELLGAWDERLAATQDPSREDWRLFPKLRPEPTASDALAHFLDESRSTHLAELFQTTDPSLEPEGVEREVFVRAPNRADGRSIDLVIRWPGARRSSIEIKIDDTQLLKTRDAADLAEESFPSEWTHFLLLRQEASSALDARSLEQQRIRLVTWTQVATALRRSLWARPGDRGIFALCGAIEQQILDFPRIRVGEANVRPRLAPALARMVDFFERVRRE